MTNRGKACHVMFVSRRETTKFEIWKDVTTTRLFLII